MAKSSLYESFQRNAAAGDSDKDLRRIRAAARKPQRYHLSGSAYALLCVYPTTPTEYLERAFEGLDIRSLGLPAWIEADIPTWEITAMRAEGFEAPTAMGLLLYEHKGQVRAVAMDMRGCAVNVMPEVVLAAGGKVKPVDPFAPDALRFADAMRRFGILPYSLLAMMRVPDTCLTSKRKDGVIDVTLAPVWGESAQRGVPPVRPLADGDRLGDRVIDFASIALAARRMGLRFELDLANNERSIGHLEALQEAVGQAEHLVLSPLVMDTLRGMQDDDCGEAAGRLAALPYPLVWIEWTGCGAEIGLAGDDTTRWGMIANATTDDPRGPSVMLILGTDSSMDGGLGFRYADASVLRFDGGGDTEIDHDFCHIETSSFASLQQRFPERAVRDPVLFGKFLLNLVSLVHLPRATRSMAPARTAESDARDRKRQRCGLNPAIAFKEVRLVVDVGGQERVLAEAPPALGHGGASSGKVLHQVRGFWRVRLGKEEYVRPHWRGNAQIGMLRKRVLLVAAHEADVGPAVPVLR